MARCPIADNKSLSNEEFSPEHHVMVGAALLTAYRNAGGDIELSDSLVELMKRGKQVPGGINI